jgi:hypothetical protein
MPVNIPQATEEPAMTEPTISLAEGERTISLADAISVIDN